MAGPVSVAAASWQLWVAMAVAALLGVPIGARLVDIGMQYLDAPRTRGTRTVGSAAAALGGIAGGVAAAHAGSWWVLAALLAWAYALAAAATCDATRQRIPTRLVWRGAAWTALLVVLAAVITGQWRWAVWAAVSAIVAGAILAVCWRFAGAGFGDVRLAVLGGLGLVHPTRLGLASAVGVFILITVTQAVVTIVRGGNRRSMIPYGPAMGLAFVIAATV